MLKDQDQGWTEKGQQQVQEPTAGRDLDALIAEKVMGLTVMERDWPCGYVPDGCDLEVYVPRERQEYDTDDERFARDVEANESHRDAFLDERHPVYELKHERFDEVYRIVVPFYSTSIADAWRVVERMHFLGFTVAVMCDSGDEKPSCEIAKPEWQGSEVWSGDTAPLAICLAALKALSA